VKNGSEWTGYMTGTTDITGLNSTNLLIACKTLVCAVTFCVRELTLSYFFYKTQQMYDIVFCSLCKVHMCCAMTVLRALCQEKMSNTVLNKKINFSVSTINTDVRSMFSKGPIVTVETFWTIRGKSPDDAHITSEAQSVKGHTMTTNVM
jgi:hypothetical protein